jgi:hypothetical protein
MWTKDWIFDISLLREICGEVLRKSPKLGVVKKILFIDSERMHGNISCSLDTWHSRIFESVDSLELLKPRFLELLLTFDLIPQSILNNMISNIVILTQKSGRKDLARSFEPWSLGKVI